MPANTVLVSFHDKTYPTIDTVKHSERSIAWFRFNPAASHTDLPLPGTS